MEDFIVENLLENKKMKVGLNSKKKGNRVELAVVKLLNERFESFVKQNNLGSFSRSVASGARWAQASNMPSHAIETFTSDIVSPKNFKFSIEVKGGYDNIDLFQEKLKSFDKFLKQSEDDCARSGKLPLVFFKQSRKPFWCFSRNNLIDFNKFERAIKYENHTGVLWKELHGMKNNFFFDV